MIFEKRRWRMAKIKEIGGIEVDDGRLSFLTNLMTSFLEEYREEIFATGEEVLVGEEKLSPSEKEEVIMFCLRQATWAI
jgi:hypothetical protein